MSTIAVSFAVVIGIIASRAAVATGLGPVVVALIAGVACVAVSLAAIGRGLSTRSVPAAVSLAALVFGALRGLSVAPEWAEPTRGPVQTAREVVVGGTVRPGPRCQVPVGPARLALPESASCELTPGDRLFVIASAWRPVDPWPGVKGRSIEAKVVLRRATDAAGFARSVANARQRAWVNTRGDPAAAFTAAVAFGLPAAVVPRRRAALRRAGMGHLLAVSGIHVGLLALWVQVVVARWFAFVPRGRALATIVAWLPMVAYVIMSGASPSAIRAGTMASLVAVAHVIGRPHHATAVLATCAAGMLVWRPEWASDIGFQLSFAAMFALVPRAGDRAMGAFRATWRITWVLAPITLWHFGSVAWAGVLTNPIALPVFGLWTLPASIVGWTVEPWFGSDALEPARWGAQVLLDLAELGAKVPPPGARGLWVCSALGAATLVLGGRGAELSAGGRDPRDWLRRLVPPSAGVLGLLVVLALQSVGSASSIAPGLAGLTVFESGRQRAVMVRRGRRACLIGVASISSRRWLGLVAEAGVERVALHAGEGRGVRALELAAALDERGLWDPTDCHAREIPQRWTDPCRPVVGRARGILAGGSASQGPTRCWTAGRWVAIQAAPGVRMSARP